MKHKLVRGIECPACSCKVQRETGMAGVYVCVKCDVIHGRCRLGESCTFAWPRFHPNAGSIPPEQTRYFDLTCLGSEGIRRRHGWVDKESKLLAQIG